MRRVRISVTDSGAGIGPEERQRIFDKFYRAKDAADRKGSGLGLPIAKRMVEAHGGKIWVEPEPAQKEDSHATAPTGAQGGTIFTFEIPIREISGRKENIDHLGKKPYPSANWLEAGW